MFGVILTAIYSARGALQRIAQTKPKERINKKINKKS